MASGLVLPLLLFPFPAAAAEPSFDCAAASGAVEQTICSDERLAALDRELATVWERALAALPEEELPRTRAYQRGWIKGRNDCWKSEALADCVRAEYERRITELQIQAGLVQAPDAVRFSCDSGRALRAIYYANTKRPAAVLTSGDDWIIAFAAPTGSGTLYEGADVRLREHSGEVWLDWRGEATLCREAGRGAAGDDPCRGLPSDASFVVATAPAAGATVRSPFEVVGCSRTFESTVTWRLLARDGSLVAEGVASGGGAAGARPFRFTVDAEEASGLHHLEVDEPRVTDEGFPPGRTVLPLVLATSQDP